ncbi:hypothetical protein RCH11_000187 [Glaciihabitans sp. GrIS 2.15]|nr:hypothetical protein [Glaciihabitans sp. GrIS 2.15]
MSATAELIVPVGSTVLSGGAIRLVNSLDQRGHPIPARYERYVDAVPPAGDSHRPLGLFPAELNRFGTEFVSPGDRLFTSHATHFRRNSP